MPSRPIVLTRQPVQAGAVEAGLAAAGLDVRFCPLTDFELPGDPGPLRAVVSRVEAGECAWLVLTSPNTVRALQAAGWSGRVGGRTRVAVTGEGTARLLPEAGCTAAPWMPGHASAAGILADFPSAETIAGTDTGTAVEGADADAADPAGAPASLALLPQSALATGELSSGLEAKGWTVARVEAYRTVPYPADPGRRLLPESAETAEDPVEAGHETAGTPTADAEAEGSAVLVPVGGLAGCDVVLTSPSAARELALHHGLDDDRVRLTSRLVAIGRPTAAEARRLGLELSAVAESPDAAGILTALGHGLTLDQAARTADEDGHYAHPGPLRDRLVGAIEDGTKTATAALLRDFAAAGEPLPRVGMRERVLDSAGRVAAVVEVTGVAVVPLGRVPDWHAVAEGEGDQDARSWRVSHERFWGGALPDDTEVVLIHLARIA